MDANWRVRRGAWIVSAWRCWRTAATCAARLRTSAGTMSEFDFDAEDEKATDRFGAALAAVLPPGTVIALVGTLGAGKTRLVQSIAAAYGLPREEVVSPTFVLCQQYAGSRTINHLDAYRVRDIDEFRALGVEELFDSEAITIVEWADRVSDIMPDDLLWIEIDVTGPTGRRIVVRADGTKYEPIIAALEQSASRR